VHGIFERMTRTRDLGTRGDETYAQLRSEILAGRLHPGERLKSAELCQRFGTSVGATREALTRLQAEGLVRGVPHIGFTVTPLTAEDLLELSQTRMEIEPLVLGLSIEAGDLAWEAQAVAAWHVLERTPLMDADDPVRVSDEWGAAHVAFHSALLAACPNRRLLRLAQTLREEAGLYQFWSVSLRKEPHRDGIDEHRALLEATVARDVPLAKDRLREHLAHTTRLLIEQDQELARSLP
jgi:DNA-binding GntR family transcriptional regulator